MSGPLSGLRVLDLSRVLAGPWATQLLADLGADVLKIERPGSGDDTRSWGPPFLRDASGRESDAAYYLCANRGKTSRCVDLRAADGQAEIRALAARCDVLVENFRPGALAKYGLDYASLSTVNPAMVYCSITGFGQSGPGASRAGYDFMIQGMGGLMSVTGTGQSGPQKVGLPIADLMTGMYAGVAILGALYHRQRTGEGQHIDLALLDCQVAMLANQAAAYLVGGELPRRLGNAHPHIVPYQVFATGDGHIIVAVGNDAQFARLCACLGHPEWVADPRFATNPQRVTHRERLVPLLQALFLRDGAQAWLARLAAADIPCGPVNDLREVFDDPQLCHREMLRVFRRADGTDVPFVANPIRYSRTDIRYERPPPALGEGGPGWDDPD